MGDFNEILYQHEKERGQERASWQMEAFQQCLMDCDLQDLGCEGDPFTWCNHREVPGTASEQFRLKIVRSHKDKAGRVHGTEGEIQSLIISYFTDIFQSSHHDTHANDACLAALAPRVSEEILAYLDSDTTSCVLQFLNEGILDPTFNHTHNVLLPKCDCSERVTDFIPISLCNVIYKITSKAIANRLKPFLGSIISELIVFSSLKSKRGPRQEDPLSLYLFLLCAKAFSGLLQQEEWAGNIQGVSICRNGPAVFHFLFANDTLISCQATKDAVLRIRAVLQILEVVSGLKMNLGKSVVVFSKNIPMHVRAELALILRVPMVAKHDKYLGLPSVVGKSKQAVFDSIRIEFGGRFNAGLQRSCRKLVMWL
ncbi:UNVERIFIED_CONTAM: hypothetical protein Slati_0517800 [Sesamum latifolium]|uniref:Reverse transcriptase domain-containing protein n=1 Tax=Sesamum latifolium TaxID=2727402 RepID=A0AAW2Y0N9_9LAMI